MQTHRAYHDAATALTCWVRGATGKTDLTAATLRVPLYPYGSSTETTTLAATTPAAGQVQVTVPSDTSVGLYRFAIEADGAVVYDGLLEVM